MVYLCKWSIRSSVLVQLLVDPQAETVLCPMNNQLVPFHIGTVKGVHKTDQADGSIVLRLAFHVPGTSQAAMNALPVSHALIECTHVSVCRSSRTNTRPSFASSSTKHLNVAARLSIRVCTYVPSDAVSMFVCALLCSLCGTSRAAQAIHKSFEGSLCNLAASSTEMLAMTMSGS